MSELWTAEAMVAAMEGRPFGQLPKAVSGISIDTRTLNRGEAFFAIKGETFDGHDFATAAVAAGAALMVVAEGRLPGLGRLTCPMIVVKDVLVALERLAEASRRRSKAKIIAVTGSVGKTTTKEALRHALSGSGTVHAAERSFNNHWGVPLTLARMPEDTDFGVFEIGMNHAGEIRPLVKLVRPHVAIVTIVAAAHLGHFHSLDDIARAKAEIFEGLEPDGHALINRDDARWRILQKAAKDAGVKHIHGFGEHARATYRLAQAVLKPDHSSFTARIGGAEIVARIGAPGRHMVQNALAVLGAVHLAGGDVAKAAAALGAFRAEKGRGARHVLAHPDGPVTLIDESYNANPASMKAAIALLAGTQTGQDGRRIAVLGDMLELGAHSAKLHAGLAEPILEAGLDRVYLAGEAMAALRDALAQHVAVDYRPTREALQPVLLAEVGGGDAVMVKSSLRLGFAGLIDALLEKYPPQQASTAADEG
ncbi:MAG: UDP-N-acetylmuramoylalanyl-D-glutamyl-2,6-diaminopimelate--D-alanyl-D-alanine ligase [Nitratireductor sp.]